MQNLDNMVRISFRHENFRISLGRPFLPVACSALALTEGYYLAIGAANLQTLLVIVPASVLLVCVSVLTLMCLHFKFEVGPDGIDCYDTFCRPHRTSWDDVTAVKSLNVLGLRYLIVSVAGQRRAIWIPLFVTRYAQLRDLLITYADESHHLQEKLAEAC